MTRGKRTSFITLLVCVRGDGHTDNRLITERILLILVLRIPRSTRGATPVWNKRDIVRIVYAQRSFSPCRSHKTFGSVCGTRFAKMGKAEVCFLLDPIFTHNYHVKVTFAMWAVQHLVQHHLTFPSVAALSVKRLTERKVGILLRGRHTNTPCMGNDHNNLSSLASVIPKSLNWSEAP
tara:strand:+ start:1240 stop:1773 length:534 start_codon:yes stop_codon:yes gene_type:complete